MKSIRWTDHALQSLVDREIEQGDAELAVSQPEFVVPNKDDRKIYMRRYKDQLLGRDMLIRAVVVESVTEIVVVTVYKTSQVKRYLKGLTR